MLLDRGTGWTRDVSTEGVFFETAQAPALGEPLVFALLLERQHVDLVIRLRCEGRVVRLENPDGKAGVAASIGSFEVESVESPTA